MKTKHDIDLLLSAQNAMLGEIPSSLRTISFDLSKDGEDLVARFEFDGEPDENEEECVSVIMTNILLDYSKNHRSYDEQVVSVPYPLKPNFLRLVAFFRYEDDLNENTNN